MTRHHSGRVSEADFSEVVSRVYDAALGSLTWAEALPSIVRFMGGERGAFGVRPRSAEAELVLQYNMDPEAIARWSSEFDCYDPWVERFADQRRPGELLHGGSEAFLGEIRETEVYASFFEPVGVDDIVATSVAARGYIGVYRSRSEGLFEQDDLARARLLAPHLLRAAAIHEQIGALGQEAAAAEAVLECVPYGVLVLDERGALLWANRLGDRLLRDHGGLVIRTGTVRAREPRVDAELLAAYAAGGRVATGRISIPAGATGRRLELMVVRVGPRSGGTAFAFTPRRAHVALVVADPTAATALPAEAIAEVLPLPPALARLASALSAGKTVVEYAADAGVTEGTARQQLKELLARGGVRRQADLIRVLQRSVAALSLPDRAAG